MNRRGFVQTLAGGALGTLAVQLDAQAQTAPKKPAPGPMATPAAAQDVVKKPVRQRVEMPPDAVYIGSNENPYGPSPLAIKAAQTSTPAGNRYGGGATGKLVDALATKHGVKSDFVMLSGGSGDVLRSSVATFTSKTRGLVTGLPSYESPARQAQHLGVPLREVPLTPDLRLDLATMARRAFGAGLVYICNPNNPTSTVVPIADVTALIEKVRKTSPSTYVLVDEAYFEYADHPGFGTAIGLVEKNPHVIVARTFSKIHGMAGMRVGYAIAHPDTLEKMRENHSSSGLSVMSAAAAVESLADTATMEKNRDMNRAVRRATVDTFTEAGYQVAASDANFVFVDVKRDSKQFQESCQKEGVAIGRAFPPLTTWARITMGTKDEMDRAMVKMMKVLSTPPPPPEVKTKSGDGLEVELDLPSELT
jgi:histidinol-phosphate aminotransferase